MLRQAIVCVVALVVWAHGARAGDPSAARHVLVEPARHLTAGDRAELAAAGLTIGKPVPGGRYLATLKAGARVENDPRVRTIGPIRPAEKIHPSALREAGRAKAFADLNVFFHDGVSLEEAQAAIAGAGGTLEPLRPAFGHRNRLTVRLPGHRLPALAADDRVLTITHAVKRKRRKHNASAAALSGVGLVHASPYSLTGNGVDLSLMEVVDGQGPQTTHPDFGGRLLHHQLPTIPHGPAFDTHATHVAGTIGGSGAGNATARGMAPGATLHGFEVGDSHQEVLAEKQRGLQSHPIAADNNSWGYILDWDWVNGYWEWQDLAEYMGAYDLEYTAPFDRLSLDENALIVFSAGNNAVAPSLGTNGAHRHYGSTALWCYSQPGVGCPAPCSGPQYCEATPHSLDYPWTTVGDMASAKNVIAVGALDSGKQLASFSSRGPARDGRVKPDLVAQGVGLYSTWPNGTYQSLSGTSMAAPVVTGIAGLLTQAWRNAFGADPPAMALKTLMIAGAEDLGNPGPDYSYGHGLVNAKNAADLIAADGGAGTRVRIASLNHGGSYQAGATVTVPQTLRVVLGWADPDIPYPGGTAAASPALVNDLDLVVIGPGGAVHRPYVLDRNDPAAAATRAANHLDNVEVVEIVDAAAGTYHIVIDATNIADDPPQQFVLVSAAPLAGSSSAPVALTATGTGAPSVTLSWSAVGMGTSYDVYSRSGSGPYALRASGLTSPSFNDTGVAPDTAYLYQVVANLSGGGRVWSDPDLATTVSIAAATGEPVAFGDIEEIRQAAASLRSLAGLGVLSLTQPPAPGGPVYASQLAELQSAVNSARTTLGLPAATFPRVIAPGMNIRAADFTAFNDALR